MTAHRHTTHHYWRLTAPTSKLCKDVRCNQWWWDSLPKTNSSSLKIGGWKTICLLGNPICSGAEISFREGNPVTSSCTKIIVNHVPKIQQSCRFCEIRICDCGNIVCWSFYQGYNHAVLYVYNRISEHAILFELHQVYILTSQAFLRSFQIFQMRLQATTPWQKKTVQENFQAGHSSDHPETKLWSLRLISAIAGKENKNTNIAKTLLSIMSSIHTWCVQLFGFKSDSSILVSLGSEPGLALDFPMKKKYSNGNITTTPKCHLKTQKSSLSTYFPWHFLPPKKGVPRRAVGSCDISKKQQE